MAKVKTQTFYCRHEEKGGGFTPVEEVDAASAAKKFGQGVYDLMVLDGIDVDGEYLVIGVEVHKVGTFDVKFESVVVATGATLRAAAGE